MKGVFHNILYTQNKHNIKPTKFLCSLCAHAIETKQELNDDSPLSAASSSGTRTVPMPHFQHLLASLQVRLIDFSALSLYFSLSLFRSHKAIIQNYTLWRRMHSKITKPFILLPFQFRFHSCISTHMQFCVYSVFCVRFISCFSVFILESVRLLVNGTQKNCIFCLNQFGRSCLWFHIFVHHFGLFCVCFINGVSVWLMYWWLFCSSVGCGHFFCFVDFWHCQHDLRFVLVFITFAPPPQRCFSCVVFVSFSMYSCLFQINVFSYPNKVSPF